MNMMMCNMDHTISSSQPLSNCRQTADKADVILARRRRTELRRLKALSNADDCLPKRRRFVNMDNDGDPDFLHRSSVIGRRGEMEDALLAAEMEAAEEMNWEGLMVDSFVKMDEEVNEADVVGSMGSTAVVAVVSDDEIVVANCGDSRAVLSRGGAVVPLSNDHKPDRPDELERIEDSGGRVVNWNGQRVLGILSTSRSIARNGHIPKK
ncbi:hypothetical protein L1987_52942 [Smallanthus sonchifolius]|uniref:Uncharacterized protein n=1 Tax=Smallanthus sonchifolius TaxID=185202 RepID=A0ACB9EUJ2_9ASTR|nr:hypothetical protein L1987_52942 [Smallanthus sonchifolius]